jgi:hypothetical protein
MGGRLKLKRYNEKGVLVGSRMVDRHGFSPPLGELRVIP